MARRHERSSRRRGGAEKIRRHENGSFLVPARTMMM
jgi:hypothetical protein